MTAPTLLPTTVAHKGAIQHYKLAKHKSSQLSTPSHSRYKFGIQDGQFNSFCVFPWFSM